MRGRLVLICILLLFYSHSYSLIINEIVASNSSTNSDGDGDFSDWLELYNETNETLQLGGFYLSDDPAEPQKWKVPDYVLAPQSFLLIWCSAMPENTIW